MAGVSYSMAYNGLISTPSVLFQTMQKLLPPNTSAAHAMNGVSGNADCNLESC